MGTSLSDLHWKHADSTGNHPGRADFDFALLTPSQLPAFSHTKAFTEALRNVEHTDARIAAKAGLSKGHLSKLRTGLWEEQANRMQALLLEVGHIGPAQKLLFDLGFEVKRRKPRKPRGKA